jgi:hypothetical protein
VGLGKQLPTSFRLPCQGRPCVVAGFCAAGPAAVQAASDHGPGQGATAAEDSGGYESTSGGYLAQRDSCRQHHSWKPDPQGLPQSGPECQPEPYKQNTTVWQKAAIESSLLCFESQAGISNETVTGDVGGNFAFGTLSRSIEGASHTLPGRARQLGLRAARRGASAGRDASTAAAPVGAAGDLCLWGVVFVFVFASEAKGPWGGPRAAVVGVGGGSVSGGAASPKHESNFCGRLAGEAPVDLARGGTGAFFVATAAGAGSGGDAPGGRV